jgi:Tol biopolymer transport system component
VSALGISKDSKNVVYKVTTPSIEENKSNSKFYVIPVNGGSQPKFRKQGSTKGQNISPDGKYLVYSEEVKINDVLGKDFYLI